MATYIEHFTKTQGSEPGRPQRGAKPRISTYLNVVDAWAPIPRDPFNQMRLRRPA